MPRHTTRTPEQVAAFKTAVSQRKPLQDAMLAAGYAPGVARKGVRALAKPLRQVYLEHSKHFMSLGRELTAADQEALVRGRLASNVIEGKDAGVNSAKLLGQDRRVNMFTPDNQVGIIVIGDQPKIAAELVTPLVLEGKE